MLQRSPASRAPHLPSEECWWRLRSENGCHSSASRTWRHQGLQAAAQALEAGNDLVDAQSSLADDGHDWACPYTTALFLLFIRWVDFSCFLHVTMFLVLPWRLFCWYLLVFYVAAKKNPRFLSQSKLRLSLCRCADCMYCCFVNGHHVWREMCTKNFYGAILVLPFVCFSVVSKVWEKKFQNECMYWSTRFFWYVTFCILQSWLGFVIHTLYSGCKKWDMSLGTVHKKPFIIIIYCFCDETDAVLVWFVFLSLISFQFVHFVISGDYNWCFHIL